MSCKCEHPEPKHKLGVFCINCNGFIEANNEVRGKLIDDQAKIHPWFEKKPPIKKNHPIWPLDKNLR